MKTLSTFLAVALTATTFTSRAQADAQGNMTRALVNKYGGSVVTLRLVLKNAGGGGDQAQMEAQGVVIDPSGTVATTNTAIDPYSLLSGMMGGDGASATSVASIRMRLASGEELPARVVLRDKDRNLAIVRPLKQPAKPLVAVNFKGSATSRLGDAVYIVGRLGKAGSRQSQATVQRVVGVVDKPRRMYVLDPNAYMYLGNVVFNEGGQPLGLLSIRVKGGIRSFSPSDTFLAMVIPTADVWEVALQAPDAHSVREARPRKAVAAGSKPAAVKR